jgi:D-threo-aldose 1-dehydrogenase
VTTTDPIPVLDRLGPLGFGAAALGNLFEPMSDERADATVATAWAGGIRYFDTAPHYGLGLSERRLGRALAATRGARTDLIISTKVGRLIEDGHPPRSDLDSLFAVTSSARRTWDFSADGVRRSLDDSLQRLGLDRVDIALVHDPDDHVDVAVDEAMPALCRLRDEGVVAAVGLGVNDADLAARFVTRSDLDVVLIAGRYTLLDQRAARTLLPACVAGGVAVIAAAPYNSGLLSSERPSAGGRFDYAAAPDAVVARATEIATVCGEHGIELPEAALRFPLQHPAVATVLVGCGTPDEVSENAARVAAAAARESHAWDGLWADLRARGLVETEQR